jgi:hypothetical protein
MKLLCFFFFIPLATIAQPFGYKPGFLVKNNNDTLFGLVKHIEEVPYRILINVKFKSNKEDKAQSFPPDSLKGFVIDKTKYVSKYLSLKKHTYFFRATIEEYLSYYELDFSNWGANKISHYVILQKGDDDHLFTYEENNFFFPFKKKLSQFLSDDPDLSEKIKHNIYNEMNIDTIVKEYNQFIKKRA